MIKKDTANIGNRKDYAMDVTRPGWKLIVEKLATNVCNIPNTYTVIQVTTRQNSYSNTIYLQPFLH